jgi:hypothetical protein
MRQASAAMRPDIERDAASLGVDAAGIGHDARGIPVDVD